MSADRVIADPDRIEIEESHSYSSVSSSTGSPEPQSHPASDGHLENASSNDMERGLEDDLETRRSSIRHIIECTRWKEGDDCCVIPDDYYQGFLDAKVDSFAALKAELGPLDFHRVVNNSGYLLPADEELVTTRAVPRDVFSKFSEWFGVLGQPVFRSMIADAKTGEIKVERWPMTLIVRTVGKRTPSVPPSNHHHHHQQQQTLFRSGVARYNSNSNNHHNELDGDLPVPVAFSRTKSFSQLISLISSHVLKSPKSPLEDFRLWFISHSKENELPFHLGVQKFVFDIETKTVVTPKIYDNSLLSEGVTQPVYHVVMEKKERASSNFPVDVFVKAHADYASDKTRRENGKGGGDGGGRMGLSNLGNTCYMNSALQCLLHVPEINDYFFYDIYQKELNLDNPLGYNGDVANSFGSLLKSAFNPAKHSSSISPRDFKTTIGRYSSMFSGYLQQDSQELLSWLLDALHEDLNRIHTKPYCEKPELKDDEINDQGAVVRLAQMCWNQHKQRNDSVIIDLFTGLYQSTLVCPDCNKTSITFDPFNDLTLPLPMNKKWYHTFTIVDLSPEPVIPTRVMKLEVELKKTSNYDELVAYFSNFLKVPSRDLFLYEIFQHGVCADFQFEYNKNKFMPIGDVIGRSDDVFVYIIPHDPDTDLIIPVFNVVEDDDRSYQMVNYFGFPLFIVINKDNLNSFGTIRRKLLEATSVLTSLDLVEEYEKCKQLLDNFVAKKFYEKSDFTIPGAGNKPLEEKEQDEEEKEEEKKEEEKKEEEKKEEEKEKEKEEKEEEEVKEEEEEKDEEVKVKAKDREKVKEEDITEYDSDVSLADPYLNADFGFKIMYVLNHNPAHYVDHRALHGRAIKQPERKINMPFQKPNSRNFKPLLDEVPEAKRKFYQHSTVTNSDSIIDSAGENNQVSPSPEIVSSIERDSDENEGFVVIDKELATGEGNLEKNETIREESKPPPLPSRIQQLSQLNSSDEETESEINLGSLFESTTNLPLRPDSTYSDSTKPSNLNSPVESNFDEEEEEDDDDEGVRVVDRLRERVKEKVKEREKIYGKQVPWNNRGTLVSKKTVLICNWDSGVFSKCFDNSLVTWKSNSMPQLTNTELEQNRVKLERQKKKKITLAECLNSFSTPELLGEHDLWYCPRCKDHKRATKTIQLWSCGDILTIHLKRFHSARAFSDKIDVVVDFPIEGLNVSSYVANPACDDSDCIYDLIAVDNHYGGLGGGHYTASVKNFCDGKWYYYNDSRVTEISNPEEVVSSAAYLLFYRKRPLHNKLGSGAATKLEKILSNGVLEFEAKEAKKKVAFENVEDQVGKYELASRFAAADDDYEESYDNEVGDEKESNSGIDADSTSNDSEDDVTMKARKQRLNSMKEDGGCGSGATQLKKQKTNSSPSHDNDGSESEHLKMSSSPDEQNNAAPH
ncbi:uncharacterized protein LODBEIA_P05480 [Lodderomyces beijingensis]|uniref:ubiquitinyl hydrolase 1 n=1 Tax=Lodderomyces beijingensis TaxID=1775926 RepID=A0ABP0ZDS3_9ASCO